MHSHLQLICALIAVHAYPLRLPVDTKAGKQEANIPIQQLAGQNKSSYPLDKATSSLAQRSDSWDYFGDDSNFDNDLKSFGNSASNRNDFDDEDFSIRKNPKPDDETDFKFSPEEKQKEG
jgi:hypothetical protein